VVLFEREISVVRVFVPEQRGGLSIVATSGFAETWEDVDWLVGWRVL